jgi:hypothetical protein
MHSGSSCVPSVSLYRKVVQDETEEGARVRSYKAFLTIFRNLYFPLSKIELPNVILYFKYL